MARDEVNRARARLACAEADLPRVRALAETLARRRIAAGTLPGVDLDLRVLARDMDAEPGPVVYVLCESEELDPFQIRRLEGLFSANHGPRQVLVRIHLDEPVEASVETIARTTSGLSGTTDLRGLRTTTGSAAPEGPSSEDPVAPPGTSAPSKKQRGPPPSGSAVASPLLPEDSARASFVALVEQAAESHGRLSTDAVKDGDTDLEAPPPAADRDRPLATGRTSGPGARDRRPDGSRIVRTGPAPPEPARYARTTPVRPVPRRASSESDRPAATPPRSRGSLRVGLVIAGVLLLGSAGIATLQAHLVKPPPRRGPRAARAIRPSAGSPASIAPARTVRDEPSEAPKDALPGAANRRRAFPSAGSGGTEATRTPADAGMQRPGVLDAGSETPPSRRSKVPPPVQDRSPSDPDRRTLVVDPWPALRARALAHGAVRERGGLVFYVPPQDATSFRRAAALCTAPFGGVDGWRLPSVRDLRKLRRAGSLAPDVYWSRTRTTKDGDELFVLDRARKLITARLAEEPTARALCVLDRKRARPVP